MSRVHDENTLPNNIAEVGPGLGQKTCWRVSLPQARIRTYSRGDYAPIQSVVLNVEGLPTWHGTNEIRVIRA